MQVSPKVKARLLFVLPGLLFLLTVLGYPLGMLVYNSFFRYNFAGVAGRKYIGFENYQKLFTDERFLTTLWNTLVFTVSAIAIELILGVIIALLLNRVIRGQRLLVGILILPTAAMPVAVGLIFRYMFNNEYGIISYFLQGLGLIGAGTGLEEGILSNPAAAMAAIIATDVWEWTPFIALVCLGGLISLSREPYEAARIDGASSWRIFWSITLPLLKPVLMVAVLIRLSDAAKVLDIVYVLTKGGPGISTETSHLMGYLINFKQFNMGYGSAQMLILTLIVLAISVAVFQQLDREN